jgi:hypothetical protein
MKLKYKHILIAVCLGGVFQVVGALFKILHWGLPIGSRYYGAGELLFIGTILWIASLMMLIVKAVAASGNDFLNK